MAGRVSAAAAGGWWYVHRSAPPSDTLVLYGNVDVRQVSLAFNAHAAGPANEAPDALVKRISQDVIETAKSDKAIQAGDTVRAEYGGSNMSVHEMSWRVLQSALQRQPLRFSSTGQIARDGLYPAQFEARRNANDAPQVVATTGGC
mgnify:CR=1 FL=1